MNENHLFNIKNLKSIRSSLRNKSTSAEAVLWNLLKSRNIRGRKFRRQHSIDKYIVDFGFNSQGASYTLDPCSKTGKSCSTKCHKSGRI
jgi:hypothetical protein